MCDIVVNIDKAPLDAVALYQQMSDDDVGAITQFSGIVRKYGVYGEINAMELEHYPGMTEKQLEKIAIQASEKWTIDKINISHRVGVINVGEMIVFVATSSQHRHASLDSCHFIIDWLKTDAPFWKCEYSVDGQKHYVSQRNSDLVAQQKWQSKMLIEEEK